MFGVVLAFAMLLLWCRPGAIAVAVNCSVAVGAAVAALVVGTFVVVADVTLAGGSEARPQLQSDWVWIVGVCTYPCAHNNTERSCSSASP
eukprot:3523494-Alexandrium_andersonii.AAC.1